MAERDPLLNALKRVLARIERAWTQGQNARDAYGISVPYESPRAVCFCLLGACRREGGELADELEEKLRARIRERDGEHWSLTSWNDYRLRTNEQVVELVESEIRSMEAAHG